MPDRIIGILGGMGPEATADFFREIVRLTPARKDQDHIPVLIYSNSHIPDRTEAILGKGENPLPHLIHSARVLEGAGAGILAMPCNTAHYFLPELEKAVSIPFLDMLFETLGDLQSRLPAVRRVGLLASAGTVRCEIFHRVFQTRGVQVLVPATGDQEVVSRAIYRVKAGDCSQNTRSAFASAGEKLVALGAEAIILGCTEIPLVLREKDVSCPCLNPTVALAQAAVDWALGKRN